jgi:hypothetical protein
MTPTLTTTTQIIIPTERDSRTGPTRPVGLVAFDYSPQGRYIASGAMKELLVWEPFTLEVLARLGGVQTPLVGVTVSDSLQRIFACTVGKVVHVYHSSSYQSLQVSVSLRVSLSASVSVGVSLVWSSRPGPLHGGKEWGRIFASLKTLTALLIGPLLIRTRYSLH